MRSMSVRAKPAARRNLDRGIVHVNVSGASERQVVIKAAQTHELARRVSAISAVKQIWRDTADHQQFL